MKMIYELEKIFFRFWRKDLQANSFVPEKLQFPGGGGGGGGVGAASRDWKS